MSNSFATCWTVARQASLSMGFPREEYWGGLLFPAPGDLPKPGIKPVSPGWQADSLPMSQILPHQGSPGALVNHKQVAQVLRPPSDSICRAV